MNFVTWILLLLVFTNFAWVAIFLTMRSPKRYAQAQAGLPPAPSWATLDVYAREEVKAIIAGTKLAVANDISDEQVADAILTGDVEKVYEMYRTVATRGQQYGESVLLACGEQGMIIMMLTKLMRLMWSYNNGLSIQERTDSYVDIGGYSLLTLALDKWLKDAAVLSVIHADGDVEVQR